jgi:2,4-dienoyl-CoA reductase-like NADH-dependent reductase (Old Yellow Enzyme family)
MPALFDPFRLKGVTLRNRVAVSPMCQYSADDGAPTDWHLPHLISLARGGASLVVAEATAVSPDGRITPGCTGLWNDTQAEAWAPIAAGIKKAGAAPGIQIGHAGRKASAELPWKGGKHIPESDPRGWDILAPSAIAFGGDLSKVPHAMTKKDILRVRADFASAAERAREAGFEWLVLHFAHGYLAHSFFSVHANQRTDEYGGSAENRGRFLVETLQSVREVWPEDRPLSVRLGVIEFDGRDEETVAESIDLLRRMKAEGLDFVDVSLGFSTIGNIPWGPAFLAPTAARVKKESGLPASVGWFITQPEQADGLVRDGSIDLVTLARPMLENPHWPYMAAKALKIENAALATLPIQYANNLQRYSS